MNAVRIPKDGRHLHHYCNKCKGDQLHEIIVIEYKTDKVIYKHCCDVCYEKWCEYKKAINEVSKDDGFPYQLSSMTNDKWNEFNKWADYE